MGGTDTGRDPLYIYIKLSLKPECTVWALHDLLIVVLLLLLSHVTPVWPCGSSSRDGETNQLRVGGATQSISPWSWWSRSAAGAQAPLEHRS